MDRKKIRFYVGIYLLVMLLAASPVAAQSTPPNDDLHINSAGVQSGELPAPLPDTSSWSNLPDMQLPLVDHETWPENDNSGLKSDIEERVTDVNEQLQGQYEFVIERIYDARSLTNQAQSVVGDPLDSGGEALGFSVQADGDTEITAASAAEQLAGAIRFAMAYMRSLTDIGPLGLDIVFVFIGLAWIVVVNMADMAVRISSWLLSNILKVLTFVFGTLFQVIVWIINIILDIIGILWPF